MANEFVIPFSEISNKDVPVAGGKNASLGEMINHLGALGIQVPGGFVVTAAAYRYFIQENKLETPLRAALGKLDTSTLNNLDEVGKACRKLVGEATMPPGIVEAIMEAYNKFAAKQVEGFSVAVRSSATAEDLPTASFAGQHDSFLNVTGAADVVKATQLCYVSLFNDRAIKYRVDNGFEHMQVALSAGVQRMVRSDKGCSGVAFTLEPETGFRNTVYITGAWGLGENVVQGAVIPDEFLVFKPTLKQGLNAIIKKKLGEKEKTMVYAVPATDGKTTLNTDTTPENRNRFVLTDKEVEKLASWCVAIEEYYGKPMDIEWAKDGLTGGLNIVQARPETVQSRRKATVTHTYKLKSKGREICTGKAVGNSIISGRACIINSLEDAFKVQQGDIIIADITNPDWNALLKKAVSIVTNKGGRTSHASIIARELGIPAVVGTTNATSVIHDGQIITVSCIESDTGHVYDGKAEREEKEVHIDNIPETHTAPMLILANPEKAFELSFYPNKGVGLLRMEFIISNSIVVHPMALVKFNDLPSGPDRTAIEHLTRGYSDKRRYFIEKLSTAVAQVAAAFYPHDVIVRMSDFKTNEYASLLGGKYFEPEEENPMLGFRGASRYYNERYREGFRLECEAMKIVRNQMGLSNVKLMIPFCRTVDEGKKVVQIMEEFGLKRGDNGLEIYVMCEIPSNVILAEQFAQVFDGFSIGSNDLTQLTLGIDRDSAIVNDLFDERNEAPKWMIATAIAQARRSGAKIGLCGQAPSDYPEFASFLVEHGIDSISFNPDALLKGIENIAAAEKNLAAKTIY
ncbi:MAG TPA: phosphoenolpyruvate synthase [Chitinophagales bacterium]|nr:phosphoenolpyruvate synthase [Chitinophagales bacterium]